MNRCLELAALGELFTAPNPMVGCVIVQNGTIVAEGYHERYGEAHAEVNAFANLPSTIDPSTCIVYVNLEPCSHYGKTPPCANLIVAKRPQKLVVGTLDPHEKVAGTGIRHILEAGIDVQVGILEKECVALNKKFIKSHANHLPFITLKWAETADGFIGRAEDDFSSKQISNPQNTPFVHHLRASHMAIAVGAHTANADNPALDVRYGSGSNPLKIIISEKASVRSDLAMLQSGKTLIYTGNKHHTDAHYAMICLDTFSLDAVLHDLHNKGIQSVLVEGGAQLLQTFIDSGHWDEAVVIRSTATWGKGVAAPKFDQKPQSSEIQFSDTLSYFVNIK